MRTLALLLAPALAAVSALASAQAAPSDLLNKARTLTTLHQDASPSYHLKASFHTFDEKGAPNSDGTVEEWYQHGGNWRRTVIFNGKTDITLVREHGKPMYKTDDDFEPTFLQERIVNALFEPVDLREKGANPTFPKQDTKQLACVVVSLPVDKDDQKATFSKAYCMDADPGLVRMVQAPGGVVTTWNSFVPVANTYFAREIQVHQRGVLRGTLHVDALEGSPTFLTDVFAPIPGSVKNRENMTNLATGMGRKLSGQDPNYPPNARAQHQNGAAVIRAYVARDGHVRDVELITASDDEFAEISMAAVRTWVFKRYSVNGRMTEVETRFTVTYRFAH